MPVGRGASPVGPIGGHGLADLGVVEAEALEEGGRAEAGAPGAG